MNKKTWRPAGSCGLWHGKVDNFHDFLIILFLRQIIMDVQLNLNLAADWTMYVGEFDKMFLKFKLRFFFDTFIKGWFRTLRYLLLYLNVKFLNFLHIFKVSFQCQKSADYTYLRKMINKSVQRKIVICCGSFKSL